MLEQPGFGAQLSVISKAEISPSNVPLSTIETTSSSRGLSFVGESSFDRLGASVASIGDFNGDGFDDFAIGSPGVDRVNHNQTGFLFDVGATYVVYGNASGSLPPNACRNRLRCWLYTCSYD